MIADSINIRTFEPGDQHIVKQLILSGLSEHFGALDPALNQDLENISATYLTNRNMMLVAELDGKIIATGALIREAERTGRIVRVSVDSANRRIGIGRMIVHQLCIAARDLAFKRILVETNLDWCEAIGFYQDLGFAEYARDLESVHLSLHL